MASNPNAILTTNPVEALFRTSRIKIQAGIIMKSNQSLPAAVLITSSLAALIGMAGCQDTGPKNPEFFTQDEIHSLNATLDRQTACGARNDAMLREQHFDGARLNALGRTKLDHMLLESGPMTIYLPEPLPAGSLDARRQAILAYAKDRGRDEADIKVLPGINPATAHPASPDITRLPKTELGYTPDKASNDSSSGAADIGLSGLSGNSSPAQSGSTAKAGS